MTNLNHGSPHCPLEMVNVAPDRLQLRVVVIRERLVSLLFQIPDLGLQLGLVNSFYLVVRMHIDPESLAQGRQQVFFIHLGMALQGFVIDARCDLAQLCHRLPLEFLKRMCHLWLPSFLGFWPPRSSTAGRMSPDNRFGEGCANET